MPSLVHPVSSIRISSIIDTIARSLSRINWRETTRRDRGTQTSDGRVPEVTFVVQRGGAPAVKNRSCQYSILSTSSPAITAPTVSPFTRLMTSLRCVMNFVSPRTMNIPFTQHDVRVNISIFAFSAFCRRRVCCRIGRVAGVV